MAHSRAARGCPAPDRPARAGEALRRQTKPLLAPCRPRIAAAKTAAYSSAIRSAGSPTSHLRALVASGAASAEIAGQLGRRASVGKAAGELIVGPAGAVILGADGKKRKTTVAIRDAQRGLKLTKIKGAERAHQFVELSSHLAAQARQAAS
jgi:hypothetical protein